MTAERLLADLWLVEVSSARPAEFALTFCAEGGGGGGGAAKELTVRAGGVGGEGRCFNPPPLPQRIAYEARSPSERDAIVGKLAFLLHAMGEGHKVLRAA